MERSVAWVWLRQLGWLCCRIGVITWMEVVAVATTETEDMLRAWLNQFTILPIDGRVNEVAQALRKKYRIRLPDAIVWATTQVGRRILVTRNTKDFPPDEPGDADALSNLRFSGAKPTGRFVLVENF